MTTTATKTKCPGSGSSITNTMWDADRETAECPACGKRVRSHGFQAVLARHVPDEEGYAAHRKARTDREVLYQRCTEDAADDIKISSREGEEWRGPEWHVGDYAQGRKLAVFYTSEADAITFRDAKRKARAAELMEQFA